mgnify:CR=1 FL=1
MVKGRGRASEENRAGMALPVRYEIVIRASVKNECTIRVKSYREIKGREYTEALRFGIHEALPVLRRHFQ